MGLGDSAKYDGLGVFNLLLREESITCPTVPTVRTIAGGRTLYACTWDDLEVSAALHNWASPTYVSSFVGTNRNAQVITEISEMAHFGLRSDPYPNVPSRMAHFKSNIGLPARSNRQRVW